MWTNVFGLNCGSAIVSCHPGSSVLICATKHCNVIIVLAMVTTEAPLTVWVSGAAQSNHMRAARLTSTQQRAG